MNNSHIERSLSYAHREEMAREVHANRSTTRSRGHRARGSIGRPLMRFFSLGLSRAA